MAVEKAVLADNPLTSTKVRLLQYPTNPYRYIVPYSFSGEHLSLVDFIAGTFSGFYKNSDAALKSLIFVFEVIDTSPSVKSMLSKWTVNEHPCDSKYDGLTEFDKNAVNLIIAINLKDFTELCDTFLKVCHISTETVVTVWMMWHEVRKIFGFISCHLIPSCDKIGYCDLNDVNRKMCDKKAIRLGEVHKKARSLNLHLEDVEDIIGEPYHQIISPSIPSKCDLLQIGVEV